MTPVRESVVTMERADHRMLAVLSHAQAASDMGVVIAIGGPQYRVGSHRQFVQMARHLAATGTPTMRFDFVGMGDSDGLWDSFERVGPDIVTSIDAFTAANPDIRKVILIGLCDAASAIMMNCNRDSRIAGLVLLNPWARTEQGEAQAFVNHYYGRRILQGSFWQKMFSGDFELFRSLKDFVASVRRARRGQAPGEAGGRSYIDEMMLGLKTYSGRTLLLISEKDLTASEFTSVLSNRDEWHDLAESGRIERVDLRGADHTLSSQRHLEECCRIIECWCNRLKLGAT